MAHGKPTYLWAAERVLRKHGQPLRAREIVHYAQEEGLFSNDMHSGTPQKSMQARLSIDILTKGDNSLFARSARGVFCLREVLGVHDIHYSSVREPEFVRIEDHEPYVAQRRTPAQATEKILVVPRSHYKIILDFQGIKRDDGRTLVRLLNGPVIYIDRRQAEQEDNYKQVVTYILVTHKAKILSFRRGTFNRAAEFLRGGLCIGFGGHVSEADHTIFSADDAGVRANAERELREELAVLPVERKLRPEDFKVLGIINDDSSEVGRRHVGIVLNYEVRETEWSAWEHVQRGEASINQIRWIDALTEVVDLSEFEYWSQLCCRSIFPVIVSAQPAYRILRKKPFRQPHILVVVGNIGSGKTLATRYLVRNYGYTEVNSGRVLARLMGVRPVPETRRAQFQLLAEEFMKKPEGPERLTDALLKIATKGGAGRIVIDGVRQMATLRLLRSRSPKPIAVLFVHAAPDVAFGLYESRIQNTGERSITPEEFMKLFSAPVEREILMISEADVVLYNWSGKSRFGSALSAMADELGLRQRVSGKL